MIGDTILELDRVDSTNAYANLALSKGDLSEGTVIWAHEQFAGRGQQNHQWISEAGKNLTFTVILKPTFMAAEQQFLLNKAIALGVLDFVRIYLNHRFCTEPYQVVTSLNQTKSPSIHDFTNASAETTLQSACSGSPSDETNKPSAGPNTPFAETTMQSACPKIASDETTIQWASPSSATTQVNIQSMASVHAIPETGIKWPNDIYIGNRKIGGILIEHKIMGASLAITLAGIGININQTQFSPEIPNPVSLIHLSGTKVPLAEALQGVCQCLDRRYQALRQDGAERLNEDYRTSLLGFDEWRNYICKDVPVEGKISGVDDQGRLLVKSRTGELTPYNHGEILFSLVSS